MKGLGGVLKEPPTATADDQQQALDILTLCVTDAELKRIVVKERTGTAAWKGLRRHMLKLGEAQKIAIRTTFGNLKLGPKESLAEYFSRGRQLQADFNEIEDFEAEERGDASNRSPAITDADLIRQLFAGLAGTAWGSNVATPMLASIDINTESLDDLLNRMMWVGATMRVAGASSSGDATAGGGGGAIVPALAAGGGSGGGGGGPNPHAGKRCYSCGKIGHIKSQCRNKVKKGQQQQQQQAGSGQQQQQPKQHPSRFGPNHVALAAAMFGGSSGGSQPPAEKDQRIYLDSGCKRHLHDKSMLHDFRPSNGRVHIRWGNGKSSVVEGSGTLVLQRSSGENRERLGQDVHGNKWDVNWSGGQGSCLVVRNVSYVPDASFNLLSVRALGDKGLRTLFDGDAGYVLSRNNSKDVYSAGGLMYLAAGHSVMMKASRVDDVGLYAISSHNWEQSPAAVDAGDASCDNADETSAGSYNGDYLAAAPAAAGAPAPVTGAGAGGQAACGKAAGPGHGSAVVLAHRRLGHLNFQYLERLAANDDEDDTGAAPPVGSVGNTASDDDDYESLALASAAIQTATAQHLTATYPLEPLPLWTQR
ncbi:hypothetical protein HXX76_016199 [Chlamydomonas incerta]|uniref:CCHC-type domain-containing protein n=1 Tax=Chlamydomonas incerta TaxID=51695 RepID=A0A835S7L5_CHLIN|nr:hypothetical protein HXX76_016199 [Chlamydomonas incerta]|eukprot:KAG2422227.1 hypothetical protein HXX76_016199 [Chlamydomonas incerta]